MNLMKTTCQSFAVHLPVHRERAKLLPIRLLAQLRRARQVAAEAAELDLLVPRHSDLDAVTRSLTSRGRFSIGGKGELRFSPLPLCLAFA